jgi:hypothetical protein
MLLPVFVSFPIPVEKAIAISLLIGVPASFGGTITSFCFAVKVRALRIVRLAAPAIVRAGEHTIVISDVVGTLTVIVIGIVVLRINDGVVVAGRAIAIVRVPMTMSVSISVAVTATISISIPIAISAIAGITARAVAVSGVITTAIRSRIGAGISTCAAGDYYFAVWGLDDPIASIAAAIAFHRPMSTGVNAVP